jgi:hypothetical protein
MSIRRGSGASSRSAAPLQASATSAVSPCQHGLMAAIILELRTTFRSSVRRSKTLGFFNLDADPCLRIKPPLLDVGLGR